jgi:deoxyribodipyrimidine photo-lyase
MSCVLYWFRDDLRVSDNPGLLAAAAQARQLRLPLLPVCVWDATQAQPTRWVASRMGPHRQAWRAGSLQTLDAQLQTLGSRLLVLSGAAEVVLTALMARTQAVALHAQALWAPEEAAQAHALTRAVARGIAQVAACQGAPLCQLHWHAQSTMLPADQLPWAADHLPEVFTVFRQQVEAAGLSHRQPVGTPAELPPVPRESDAPGAPDVAVLWAPAATLSASSLQHAAQLAAAPLRHTPISSLMPTALATDARSSFPFDQPAFAPGEAAAQAHLAQYLARQLPHSYKATRNGLSGVDFSSKFSPWLATGALSAPQVMAALRSFEAEHGASDGSYWLWFELLWRDHFHLLHAKHGAALYRAQGLSQQPPPPHNEAAFRRWCAGHTGEPLVDAGMRELAATGWLSNRLACDWRAGAAWFESQLIDFDVHSNQGNWLYIAGRGTDPRGGRRFNPDKQTRDHDPDGAYRRLWGTA